MMTHQLVMSCDDLGYAPFWQAKFCRTTLWNLVLVSSYFSKDGGLVHHGKEEIFTRFLQTGTAFEAVISVGMDTP